MEFFTWLEFPQVFLLYCSVQLEDGSIESVLAYEMKVLMISLIVAGGLYLIGHVFGGIGLYKMAKRAGDKFAWMAFVPVLNTYLSGRLAGEANVFSLKVKHMGLYVTIAELLYIVLNIFLLVIGTFLANPSWNQVTTQTVEGVEYITGTQYMIDQMPLNMRWLPTMEFALQIITYIWSILLVLMFISLYLSFFRKYYARGPLMMAFICSFFPVRGYVFFAVRNNAPVDYNQWMQERIRMMQQQQYGGQPPYGAPYGGQPYGGQPYGGQPYGNYGGTDGEPFSDTTGSAGGPSSLSDDEPFSDL